MNTNNNLIFLRKFIWNFDLTKFNSKLTSYSSVINIYFYNILKFLLKNHNILFFELNLT